jgi:hypothetical protein
MLRLPRRTLLRGGAALAATKLFALSIIKPAAAAFMLGKAGGGGGGDEFTLQLGGLNLRLGGQDLTLGA